MIYSRILRQFDKAAKSNFLHNPTLQETRLGYSFNLELAILVTFCLNENRKLCF